MSTDSGKENSNYSTEHQSNEGKPQEGPIKKKRQRVGDVRKQSFGVRSESVNNERNPYRSGTDNSQSRYSNEGRQNYGERRPLNRNSYYSNNNQSRNTSDGYNRNNGYNSERGGYNSDRNNYNSDRNSYNSDRNNYNSDRNGYNSDRNNRQPYRNNEDGYNRRPNNNRNYDGGYQQSRQGNNRPNRGQNNTGGPKRLVKPVKYKENIDPNTPIRLNKYLANAGVCSRREADSFITAGVVKVNGVVTDELGTKVKRGDLVTFHDQPVHLESKVYVLLNKPKNCVTTSDDPENRKTVMDLVKGACPERIYPVGRLDRNTTGVLLLTNDGDLASKLMHPKFKKKKIYQVTLDRDVAIEDMQAIADGIELDDGEIHADSIAYQAEDVLDTVGIEIHSGRNRIVRRIFEKLGYKVMKLDRVYFAGLTKKNVLRGKWRYLTEKEVNMLRMGAFE